MHNHDSFRNLFLVLAMAGLGACASSGASPGESEPSGDAVSVRVMNDTSPPTAIVVWVVPESGNRWRLGSLQPNAQQSFRYSPMLRSMQVHLLAVPQGPASGLMQQQGEFRSDPFTMEDVRIVNWSVSRRTIRLSR